MEVRNVSDPQISEHSIAGQSHAAHSVPVVIGPQIRAGRGLVGYSLSRLAKESGVSESAIHRAELVEAVPAMRADNLAKVIQALEAAGVIFLDADDVRAGGPGVRLRRRP